jgi:alpha-tubulin suppressor-like RCC1 family protein
MRGDLKVRSCAALRRSPKARTATSVPRRALVATAQLSLAAVLICMVVAPRATAATSAAAWGSNLFGQLGQETSGPEACAGQPCSKQQVAVPGVSGITSISSGKYSSLAVLSDGSVEAWGENLFGELGDGTKANSAEPEAVSGLTGVTAVSAGSEFSLALMEDGTVLAWGRSDRGELGNGASLGPEKCAGGSSCSETPVSVSGLSGVVAVSAGGSHSLALLGDGTVMAWGANEHGQLGDGTTSGPEMCGEDNEPCAAKPVPVSGLSGVVAVSAGAVHSMALLGDGTLMVWGYGEEGELGNGSPGSSDVPEAVPGLSGVTSISAGGGYSLALLENGTVMAWGTNASGELGNGDSIGPEECLSFSCSYKPVAVTGLSNVTAVSAGDDQIEFNRGGNHSLALLGNGTVMAWGGNEHGELGIGTSSGPEDCDITSCSSTPVAVTGLSGVGNISSGGYHSLAELGLYTQKSVELPEAKTGQVYKAQLKVSGVAPSEPQKWKKETKLPKGLKLAAKTGVISGTLSKKATPETYVGKATVTVGKGKAKQSSKVEFKMKVA